MNTENELDVLADISRELVVIGEQLTRIATHLENTSADIARCGHGVTGLCMSCVIMNDLLRPRSSR